MAEAQKAGVSDIPGMNNRGLPADKELEVLRAFVIQIMGIKSVDDLCWHVAKEVVGRLGFVDCVVYRFDPSSQALVQVSAIGNKNPEKEIITNRLVIPLGKGITGQVAKTGLPEIVGDLGQDSRYIEDIVGAQSEICVPLIHDQKLLGVIDCEDPRPNSFTNRHLETLTAIASVTSAHIGQIELMDRSNALSESLRKALKKSEEAQRSQATFLANVSHELRTPLNAIVGFSTILSSGEHTPSDLPTIKEFAEHIHSAGRHLTQIVDDILDIAAMSSQKVDPERTELDLTKEIEAAANLVRNKAAARGNVIQIEVNEPNILGVFDRRHFKQILTNLLDNAVKYGNRGTPITITVGGNNDDYIQVAVTDSGNGISEENLQYIFEPFGREKSAIDKGIEGTGLGLCLAREFALANGAV